jgi:hypothetical protein
MKVYMRRVYLMVFSVLFATTAATAQVANCRQSWMPKDAPAFCSWRPEISLPQARTYHSIVTSDTSIYVLGGFRFDSSTNQVIYYDNVLRSVIGADGKLGPWTVEASFRNGRSGAGAVRVKNCIFLTGGSSSTPSAFTYYDDTQSAQIGADGKLSPWALSSNHLRTPRSNHSLLAVTTDEGTFLNAIAGVAQLGEDTVHLDTVEVAKVNSDCSIGQWTVADYHIKGGRSSPQALALDNSIVIIGGWGDLDLVDVYNDVQVSAVRADGTPSPWRTSLGHLTTGIYGHSTSIVDSGQEPKRQLLFSVGGQPGTGAYANWISYAYVKPSVPIADGIGIWRIAPTGKTPVGLAGLGIASFGERLYVIGGSDGNGQYHNDVLSAQFDFGQP